MGYVAVKGGQDAIDNARELVQYYRWKDAAAVIPENQVRAQFRFLIDKIMSEASLYAPEHAALAIQQAEGDVFEAAFLLRAYRATLERTYYSEILDTRAMLVERRISSAFRDIPGGQILGPTRDYSQRLLDPDEAVPEACEIQEFLERFNAQIAGNTEPVRTFPKVIDLLIAERLLNNEPSSDENRRV